MSDKINWRDVRDRTSAWLHIQTDIAGDKDICRCTVCGTVVEIEVKGRKRASVVLETARKHYYKHKIWLNGLQLTKPEPVHVERSIFETCE